jgi:hypothetical protein
MKTTVVPKLIYIDFTDRYGRWLPFTVVNHLNIFKYILPCLSPDLVVAYVTLWWIVIMIGSQPDIRGFLRQRFHDICDQEPYDPDEHGFFILVVPGDTSEQIEMATANSLLKACSMGLSTVIPISHRTLNIWKITVVF